MAMRLPPLNMLRIFEAAARHLSFRQAAEELCVTPSAVSHGIQGLEDWLGTPLFERGRRGLSLTDAGKAYYPGIRDALHMILVATERVPGRRASKQIRLSVTPTFAARVLLPRLARFSEAHPGVQVLIDTAHRQVDFPRDGVDVAIRLGTGHWQGLAAEHLMTEQLLPVSTPELRKRYRQVTDLRELPLIHVTSVTQDWQAWSDAVGAGPVDANRGLKVDTIQMAMDAAVRGLGVALGRRPLADPELEAGILVPFQDRPAVSQTAYWLVGLPDAMLRGDVRAFRSWLLEELRGGLISPSLRECTPPQRPCKGARKPGRAAVGPTRGARPANAA